MHCRVLQISIGIHEGPQFFEGHSVGNAKFADGNKTLGDVAHNGR